MANRVLISLGVVTSLAAVFTAYHSLILDEGSAIWIALKVLTGAFVLAANLVVLRNIRQERQTLISIRSALLAGIVLVAIGAAGMVWTLHLAVITGDMEGAHAALNALLTVEGALAIWQAGGVATQAPT